jgi:hypothetical protein
MIFARAGQADLTVVLIDDRLVTRNAGGALASGYFCSFRYLSQEVSPTRRLRDLEPREFTLA